MSGRQLYAAYRFSMRAHAYIHIPEWDDLADVKKAAWNDLASNVVWAPGARPPA